MVSKATTGRLLFTARDTSVETWKTRFRSDGLIGFGAFERIKSLGRVQPLCRSFGPRNIERVKNRMCLRLGREANRNGTCHDAGPIIISIEASFVVEVAEQTLAQCLDGCPEVECFEQT